MVLAQGSQNCQMYSLACRDQQGPPVLQVRQELQLPDPATKLALFMFGAQPPGNWCLTEEMLPPGWVCVICSGGKPLTAQPLPPNFQLAAGDAYTPDLVRDGDNLRKRPKCCMSLKFDLHCSQDQCLHRPLVPATAAVQHSCMAGAAWCMRAA